MAGVIDTKVGRDIITGSWHAWTLRSIGKVQCYKVIKCKLHGPDMGSYINRTAPFLLIITIQQFPSVTENRRNLFQ